VLKFPALVSGCTVDWFQPWPREALVKVAKHFINDFEIACTPKVKDELVEALGSIQDIVSNMSAEYFQRCFTSTLFSQNTVLFNHLGFDELRM